MTTATYILAVTQGLTLGALAFTIARLGMWKRLALTVTFRAIRALARRGTSRPKAVSLVAPELAPLLLKVNQKDT